MYIVKSEGVQIKETIGSKGKMLAITDDIRNDEFKIWKFRNGNVQNYFQFIELHNLRYTKI